MAHFIGVGPGSPLGWRGMLARGAGGFNPATDPRTAVLAMAADASDNGTTLTVLDRTSGNHNFAATGAGRAAISPTGFAGGPGLSFAGLSVPLRNLTVGARLAGATRFTVFVLSGFTPLPGAITELASYGDHGTIGDWRAFSRLVAQGQVGMQVVLAAQCDLRTNGFYAANMINPHCMVYTVDLSLATGAITSIRESTKLKPATFADPGSGATALANRVMYLGSSDVPGFIYTGLIGGIMVVTGALTDDEINERVEWMEDQYLLGPGKQVLWTGDSLTATEPGYRAQLQTLYQADRGVLYPWNKYETIGPLGDGNTWNENWHDAVGGSRIIDVINRLAVTLSATSVINPDIVAFGGVGVNNIIDGASAAVIASAWETMLISTYDLRSNVEMKLISLINNTVNPATAIAANLLGPQVVANAIAARPGMQAEWVTQAYTVSLADNVHPDAAGYITMGNALYPIVMGW